VVVAGVARVPPLQAATEAEVLARAPDADALLVFHDMRLTAATLDRLPRCRVIVRVGVGFDNVDLAAAGRNGIAVCNVPDYGTEEVADHAILLLLAVTRRLVPCHTAVTAGRWTAAEVFGTPRLRGRTLGLIGCGRIGTATALRAKALGLRVAFYDPYQPAGYEKALGLERCERLEDLLPRAQFISLHCPLTDETRHVLNAETLARLPAGAVVINTARGGCVHHGALVRALDAGQVAGAGLDVVEPEPLADEGLRAHPRVVLTPHVAFYSVEGAREMRLKAAREVRRALSGEAVWNPVNRHCLPPAPRCRV
jgi:phosphoglycerate dehydrogenase-like enzyme